MKILFNIVLLFFSCNLFSSELIGVVKDNEGIVVKHASVEVLKYSLKTKTDAFGNFSLIVKNKKLPVVIYVIKENYFPFSKKITKFNTKLNIVLEKIPKLNEKITVNPIYIDSKQHIIPILHKTTYSDDIFNENPEIITDLLKSNNDVDVIGQGGVTITPSIRGMARRRVLTLIDGVRLIGDRRVGTSISFVHPGSISFIEVVKSPSSVLYGSDAIGGVINLHTKNSIEGGYSNNLRINGGNNYFGMGISKTFKVGNFSYFFDYAKSKSDGYSNKKGKVFNSSYSLNWIKFGIIYKKSDLDFKFTTIDGTMENVGKPNRNNDENIYTINPKDSNRFYILNIKKKKFLVFNNLTLDLAFNPTEYLLNKVDDYEKKEDFSKTLADNYTFKLSFNEKIGENIVFQYGINWFFRRDIEILNKITKDNVKNSFYPIENGKRDDKSLFATFSYNLRNNMFIGGLRLTDISLMGVSNDKNNYRNEDSLTYFITYSRKIYDKFSIYINNSKAFRTPSLSELFYTGISGRKYIIGNNKLKTEKGNNFDFGLTFENGNKFIKIGYFQNTVNNLIERYEVEDGIYTFENINKGRIKGFELTGSIKLNENITSDLMYRNYSGISLKNNDYLNDIPADSLVLKNRINIINGFVSLNFVKYFLKSEIGPSEIENKGYFLTNLTGSYYFSKKIFFSFNMKNIFNKLYYQNADPDAPFSPGRTFTANINYLF